MTAPNHTSRLTGQDAIIKVGDQEFAVTNVSFDIEPDSTDVQTNQSMKPDIAITGLRYSGSFEYDGEQDTVRNLLFYSAGDPPVGEDGNKQAGEPKRFNMTVKEKAPSVTDDGTTTSESGNLSRTWTIKNAVCLGLSRDVPADDVTSSSWDFDAEDIYISSGGASDGGTRNSS
jgi:hypothetical protein